MTGHCFDRVNSLQIAGDHILIYEAYYKQLDPKESNEIGALEAAKFLKKIRTKRCGAEPHLGPVGSDRPWLSQQGWLLRSAQADWAGPGRVRHQHEEHLQRAGEAAAGRGLAEGSGPGQTGRDGEHGLVDEAREATTVRAVV
uniref:(northern house mosquito) hypothetical protein n=1 Tax=Culex pipiens TaxID=7175 RepID=A0A8D8GQT6_CULPI